MVYQSYFSHLSTTQERKHVMPSTLPYDPTKPNQPRPCYDVTDVDDGGADDGDDNHNDIPDICLFSYTSAILGQEVFHLKVRKFATKFVSQQNCV